jgi:hypothetical protein
MTGHFHRILLYFDSNVEYLMTGYVKSEKGGTAFHSGDGSRGWGGDRRQHDETA